MLNLNMCLFGGKPPSSLVQVHILFNSKEHLLNLKTNLFHSKGAMFKSNKWFI